MKEPERRTKARTENRIKDEDAIVEAVEEALSASDIQRGSVREGGFKGDRLEELDRERYKYGART